MRSAILLSILLLAGCGTSVPVKQKFPEVPNEMLNKCEELNKINSDTKLSDLAKTIADNYKLYHECSIKSEAWIEWYNIQRKIFEEVNK